MLLSPDNLWLVLFVAFAIGTAATYLTRLLALQLGVVNHPNPIVPQHTTAIAYLGGLGVALGAGITLGLCGYFVTSGEETNAFAAFIHKPLFLGSLLYLIMGIGDDLYAFKPPIKFALQVAVTGLVAASLKYTFTGFFWLDVALSALWILTIVNAVNFTDVCDGLVAGLSVVMLLFLGYMGILRPTLAAAVAGSCLGFLVWNKPQAKIFLGDAGSQMLGFLLGAGVLLGGQGQDQNNLWPFLPAMMLALSVPLFELVFLTVVRVRKGIPWWKGSPDHFALRLQAAGFSRWQTDLFAWSAAVLGCAFAFALLRFALPVQILVLVLALAWFAFVWRTLLKHPVVKR